jgi:xanthine/uracil/vitamin C permease (AzgA family)
MSRDPLIEQSEQAEADKEREARAANLFDLRRIIGALFAVYGVILVIVGLTDSDAEIDKAAGIHINLWTGVAMLAVAAFFVGWALLRPLSEELSISQSAGGGPGDDPEGAGKSTGARRE